MSTSMMVIAGALGAGLLLGLFYVSHTMEKKKAQKALLITNLTERIQRLQKFLDSLPPAYLSSELKLLLLKQIQKRLEKLLEMNAESEKFQKYAQSIAAQITETQGSTAKPPSPTIKSEAEAQQIRNKLLELQKLLESLTQSKAITLAEAQKHIAHIQSVYFEANVNMIIHSAEQAKAEGKTKLAIHQLQKAIADLNKRNKSGHYTDRINQLKDQVKTLQEQSGLPAGQSEDDDGDALTKGLDELLEEDNAWKKKYF